MKNKPATKRVANQNKQRKVPRKESTTIMVSMKTRKALGLLVAYDQTMDEVINGLVEEELKRVNGFKSGT